MIAMDQKAPWLRWPRLPMSAGRRMCAGRDEWAIPFEGRYSRAVPPDSVAHYCPAASTALTLPRLAIGQGNMTLCKNARLAGAADVRVELGIDRSDDIVFRREEILFAQILQVGAACKELVNCVFDEVEI